MKKILTLLALVALVAGCASRTAMYNAPDKNAEVAIVTIKNHLKESTEQTATAGPVWKTGHHSQPTRVGVFKVDGTRLDKQAGEAAARLRPGEHHIQIYADASGSLRFGDFRYDFEAGKTYVIHVYSSDSAKFSYRGELVVRGQPGQILKTFRF